MVELEARSPVGGTEQRLNSTGQVDKQIAHEEKPVQTHRQRRWLKRKRNVIKCTSLWQEQFGKKSNTDSVKPRTLRGWGPQHPEKQRGFLSHRSQLSATEPMWAHH